jgi:hypothetical protein
MTTCVRKAWLVLGSLTVQLENPDGGWFCTSLDLGYPAVRDVVTNRPDRDGIVDRTQYFGPRTVTAELTALSGAGAQIDAVAAQFAPFMLPGVRPVLHYILDRPGAPERTMTVRAAGYSWPVEGPYQRDIQLQWVVSDPAAIDPTERSATAWAGSSTAYGRNYNLTFNRIYPVGGGSPTVGIITPSGDLSVKPKLRIYGPITAPQVNIQQNNYPIITVNFQPAFIINAGQYVDISTADHTAFLNGDPTQSVISSIRWDTTIWGVLLPGLTYTMILIGSTTTGITQVQATWHDRWLT